MTTPDTHAPRLADYARDQVSPLLNAIGGYFRMCVLTAKALFRRTIGVRFATGT